MKNKIEQIEIEQIAIAEQKELNESYEWRAGFIAGANYYKNLMIKLSCEYFENSDFEQGYLDSYNLFDTELFIEDFKKAMKTNKNH